MGWGGLVREGMEVGEREGWRFEVQRKRDAEGGRELVKKTGRK